MYILIDQNNICQCIASEKCNLHQSKIDAGMKTFKVNGSIHIGDEFTPGKDILKDVVIGFEKVEVKPATKDKPAVLENVPITEKRLDYNDGTIIPKPENYPVFEPTRDQLIKKRMYEIAEAELIAEGII